MLLKLCKLTTSHNPRTWDSDLRFVEHPDKISHSDLLEPFSSESGRVPFLYSIDDYPDHMFPLRVFSPRFRPGRADLLLLTASGLATPELASILVDHPSAPVVAKQVGIMSKKRLTVPEADVIAFWPRRFIARADAGFIMSYPSSIAYEEACIAATFRSLPDPQGMVEAIGLFSILETSFGHFVSPEIGHLIASRNFKGVEYREFTIGLD